MLERGDKMRVRQRQASLGAKDYLGLEIVTWMLKEVGTPELSGNKLEIRPTLL